MGLKNATEKKKKKRKSVWRAGSHQSILIQISATLGMEFSKYLTNLYHISVNIKYIYYNTGLIVH